MTIFCPVCNKDNPDNTVICQYCGASLVVKSVHPFALPVGTQLKNGRYRIGRFLGSGGFGITYKGSDVSLRKVVAIKELFIAEGSSRQGKTVIPPYNCPRAEYEEMLKKFEQEALLLMKFNDPHIVKVLDVFRENNTAYIIMEYLDGENLAEYVKKRGNLGENEVIKIMIKICEAVKIIHKQNIIHRDLKPSNIIKTKDNRYVLIDFGAARVFISGVSKTMTRIATPLYAPPEALVSKGQFDQRYDIYSLGAIFYFLLTGDDPPSADVVEMSDGLDKIKNPKIKTIIKTCMSKHVANRYQNISSLLTVLEELSKKTRPLSSITTQELQEVFEQKEIKEPEILNLVKDSVTKWFSSYPRQSLTNLQQRLSFKKVVNHPMYYLVLTTLFEERKCETEEKPYEGGTLPYIQQRITLFDIDVSTLDCLLNDEFKNQGTSITLTDSIEKKICSSCNGNGIIECSDCYGKGRITCDECGGEGRNKCWNCKDGIVRCDECDGRGQIEKRCSVCRGDGEISQRCPVCNGKGRITISSSSYYSSKDYMRCESCGGYGSIEIPCTACTGKGRITCVCSRCGGSGILRCNRCGGLGFLICRECGGSGKVVCMECNGAGHVVCRRCEGRRELLEYIVYKDVHKVEESENIIFVDRFDKLYVESIVKEKYFKLILQRDTSKQFVSTFFASLPDFMKNSVLCLLTQAQNKIKKYSHSNLCQIIRQKIDVYRSDIYLVDIEFDNKDYQFWIFGRQHNVKPVDLNPIEDLFESYRNKIRELFEKKEYEELYSLIKKSTTDFQPRHKEICNLFLELLSSIIASGNYKEAQEVTQKFIVLFEPYEDDFYKLFSDEIKKHAEKRNFQKANQVYSIIESLFPKRSKELNQLSQIIDFNITLNEIEESIKQESVKKALDATQKIVKSPALEKEKLFLSYYTSLDTLVKQKRSYLAYKLLVDFSKIVKKQLRIKKLSDELTMLKKKLFSRLVIPFYIGTIIGVVLSAYHTKKFVITTIILISTLSSLTSIISAKQVVYRIGSFVIKFLLGCLIPILVFWFISYFDISKLFEGFVVKTYYSVYREISVVKYLGKFKVGYISKIRLCPKGNYLVCDNSNVYLWKLKTRECIKVFEEDVPPVPFSRDGKLLVVKEFRIKNYTSHQGIYRIKLWDIEKNRWMRKFAWVESEISEISFSPSGRYLISIHSDGTVRIWDVSNGRCVRIIKPIIKPIIRPIEAAFFTSDEKYIVAITKGRTKLIQLWEFDKGECIKTISFDGIKYEYYLSSDGKFIILLDRFKGDVEIIDIPSFKNIKSIALTEIQEEVKRYSTSPFLFLNPNREYIVFGIWRKIKIFDINTGKVLKTMIFMEPIDITIDADGKLLAILEDRDVVKMWDLSNIDKIISIEKSLEEKYGKVKN